MQFLSLISSILTHPIFLRLFTTILRICLILLRIWPLLAQFMREHMEENANKSSSIAWQIVTGTICGLACFSQWLRVKQFAAVARGAVSSLFRPKPADYAYVDEFRFIDEVIRAPIEEELLYRGVLLPMIRKGIQAVLGFFYPPEPEPERAQTQTQTQQQERTEWYVDVAANIATATIFAYAHDTPKEAPHKQENAFFMGLLFGALAMSHGLFASIAAHATHNMCSNAFNARKYFPV